MALEAGVVLEGVLLLAGDVVEAGGWRQQPGGRSERLMYCELRRDGDREVDAVAKVEDEVDAVVAVAEDQEVLGGVGGGMLAPE